jgi:predicted hydrocarbon binding protein
MFPHLSDNRSMISGSTDFKLPSNTYCSNKMGRVLLKVLREIMLRDDYSALLNFAGLSRYSQALPEDNWVKEFDFVFVAKLNQGLSEMYGPRGGRRLGLQAGRSFLTHGLNEFGSLAGIDDQVRRTVPLQTKLRDGLSVVARLFSQMSDQKIWLEEQDMQFNYHVEQCPVCWGRTADKPICFFTIGFLQEILCRLSDGRDFRVQQTSCTAMGDSSCVFRIDREPIK